MASKKKGSRKAGATTRGKKKAGARKAKAGASKAKAGARKAKASASKAKASASKAKASASKAKASASKAKAGARKAKARTRAPEAVAKSKPVVAELSSVSIIVDEVIEEPLLDVSTVLRIKDGVARTRRDVDEDELKQFPDPSLVVEAETSPPRDDDTDPSISHLPDLFAAEARRQKERLGDSAATPAPKRPDSSLFGSLDPSDDDDSDEN